MVIAGGVLIVTGVGGPAGALLISAGTDTIIQKATTGTVNWGQVALSGALGGFGGASIAAKAGLSGIKATMGAGASSGGIGGGIQGADGYFTGPEPHTVGGAAGHGLASAWNKFELRGQYSPVNRAPVVARNAASFRSASFSRVKTREEVDPYRVRGRKAGPLGGFWTRDLPMGPLQVQLDSAWNPLSEQFCHAC
ncbi:MAG: hypothetical protein LBE25_06685 [Arthrobacter sp.]|jgi:hypothetical protein|nr:hypothetical protein [Arthrobacter sp.]